MKYPKEYSKKALDILEREYFQENDVPNTALLTLAAHCMAVVAMGQKNLTFEMVKECVQKPTPHKKSKK